MPKKKSSQPKFSPLEIARLLDGYEPISTSDAASRYPAQRRISIFEIPLILDLICGVLSTDEIWMCRKVCRSWHDLFERPLWRNLQLTALYSDRKVFLTQQQKQFLGDRHFWVKSAVVNVLDSQLVEIGCSQLRRLHLKQRFSWYEWPYDEYSEEGGESSAQEEEEDEEDEEDDEFESTVDEMAVEGQGIHLGRAENALALIGLNTQLQSLTLDWDLNLRPHLTKNALDRFMEAPSLADFDLRIRHHGTLTDVILFCSHCPLSIMKLNISYCGNNAIIFDDEVQFQEDVVRKPFRSLPLLEDLSITGQITEMEDRFVFPFLGSSCPNLKRITIPDVETIEFKMPEDLSLEGDSDVLVENLFLMAESLGLGWEQTFYSFFVALMLRFAPKLEEYDLNAQLSEQELYRLASRPLLVQDSSTLPSPHHEPYRRIKAISWWIGPEMNRRVIPTLLHNFGTTLETIKLLLNDFRPDLRYLDPNWNPSVLDPSLLLLENNNVDGVQRLVPVSEIAEHTKQVLRNCPNLRILVVSHKVQTPRYHLHGQQPIIPRTGISLHDLVNVEWACSKTIRSLTLDIWDPPPRPKTGDVGQDRDDRGHEDEIKDINDEDDEDGVFQPYISEADYLSCFSYNRRSLLLNAHGNARVDALTAAEAAAFAVKEARQKSKKLSVQTVPLSELGRGASESDDPDHDGNEEDNPDPQWHHRHRQQQWLIRRAVKTSRLIYRLCSRLQSLPKLHSLNLGWLSPEHLMYMDDGLWLLRQCASEQEENDEEEAISSPTSPRMSTLIMRARHLQWMDLLWMSRKEVEDYEKEKKILKMGISLSYQETYPTHKENSSAVPPTTLFPLDNQENEEEDEYSVFKSRNQRKRATMSKIKNRA